MLGCEVRSFDPSDLPVRDPTIEDHPKVVELRALSEWSEGHVWVSPEMHGCITGAFKNQIDWLPLNTGSVRPTQGRTCVVLQVNGGGNAVAVLRNIAIVSPRHRADVATGTMSRRWRGIATPSWMRMPCFPHERRQRAAEARVRKRGRRGESVEGVRRRRQNEAVGF